MIPASYMFKDIYRREWLDPEVESDVAAARLRTGRRPHALNALGALLRRLSAPQARPSDECYRTPAQ